MCRVCADLCGQRIAEIPSLVHLLADDPLQPCCDAHALAAVTAGGVRAKASGPRVSGSGETPLPGGADRLSWLSRAADVHAADRLDADCQTGAAPVAAVLAGWVALAAEELCVSVPRVGRVTAGPYGLVRRTAAEDVARLCRFLAIQHERITRLPWSDEYAAEVGELHSRCRVMAGLADRLRRLGDCPTEGEDGTPCGATLWADPYADLIACRRCRTSWPRDRWLWLGGLLRTQAV